MRGKRPAPVSGARGLSLVAVIVSVAILGVALTMATSAFLSSSRLTKQAANFTLASNFAEGVMERVRSQPYGAIASRQVTNGLPKLSGATCEVKVAPQGDSLKQIVVTCAWREGERRRGVKLATLVAKGGSR